MDLPPPSLQGVLSLDLSAASPVLGGLLPPPAVMNLFPHLATLNLLNQVGQTGRQHQSFAGALG